MLGVQRILQAHGARADLKSLFQLALDRIHAMARSGDARAYDRWIKARSAGAEPTRAGDLTDELVTFALARFRASAGVSTDLVDAVVSAAPTPDLVDLSARTEALKVLAGTSEFLVVAQLLKRVRNILDKNGVADERLDYEPEQLVPCLLYTSPSPRDA